VDVADRDAADRDLDAGRKPVEMLTFFGIEPGMRVAELMAGRGYTAELLARVVGPQGEVYVQNNRFVLERFAEAPLSERLKKPVMKNAKRVDAELENPLPGVSDLDAVLMVLFYHDSVWQKADRVAMNRAIFAALKPGGVFGVVDHSARPGDGVKEAQTLHRIEQSVVEREVTGAGFVLEASADFLKNDQDTRDWNASPSKAAERRGTSDRFALKFVKPKG
jgi:predicted methyltransferase